MSEPFYSQYGSIGNFDFYRGTLDFSGPLNRSRTVLYRLSGAAQSKDDLFQLVDDSLKLQGN